MFFAQVWTNVSLCLRARSVCYSADITNRQAVGDRKAALVRGRDGNFYGPRLPRYFEIEEPGKSLTVPEWFVAELQAN